MKQITVTVVKRVQITETSFHDERFSRVFSIDRSIETILNWAENMGISQPTINDLEFSDYTGSST